MKRPLIITILLLIGASQANAGSWRKLYKVSQYITIGVNVIDTHSSYGRVERNPILATNGRFGSKAVTIKAGVLSGWLLIQRLTNKSGRLNKVYALTNLGSSAVIGGVAVSNYRRN